MPDHWPASAQSLASAPGDTTLTQVVIPASCGVVHTEAFYGCTFLTTVVVEEGVHTFGERVFANCPALTSITIPESLTFIHSSAFDGSPSVVLYVQKDSYGHEYAERYGLQYRLPSEPASAHLAYIADNWWPSIKENGTAPSVSLIGEGHYTASGWFVDQGGWTPNGTGAVRLMLIVESPAGTAVDGMYLGVTDVRIDGVSIPCTTAVYGPAGYDDENTGFSSTDGLCTLYDSYYDPLTNVPYGHVSWDGSQGSVQIIDPDDIQNAHKLEIDFFFTATQGVMPAAQ